MNATRVYILVATAQHKGVLLSKETTNDHLDRNPPHTEELLNQLEQATKLADWTNENDTQRESAAKALAAIRTEILNRATK